MGGAGSPVLLLHGFPQTRLTWRSVAPKLMQRSAVVCPDLSGYGDSDRLDDGPGGFDKSLIAGHLAVRTLAIPVRAAWQNPGDAELPSDPRQIWSTWAPDLHTAVLPRGHFLPEERPTEVAQLTAELIGAPAEPYGCSP